MRIERKRIQDAENQRGDEIDLFVAKENNKLYYKNEYGQLVNFVDESKLTANTGDQDLSSYASTSSVASKANYAIGSSGSVIDFTTPQIFNSPSSPSSANLTDNLTNARIGVVQKIYHNKSSEPTYPAGWVKVGTGTYTNSVLNIIYVEWVSGTRCEYWITKPAS